MWKQKMIFLSIIGAVVILISSVFLFIWNSTSDKVVKWPAEFNVWVVGDETAGYSNIITSFKAKYSEYAKTEIKFTKFSSYSDYEKILQSVMLDGNSPDIFVINNSATSPNSDWLLDSKTVWIPWNVVDADYLSKNFNRVFDELVIQNEETNEEWKKIKVSYLKWIPMWFETLGVFYNFRKVNNVPVTWSELDEEIQNKSNDSYSTIWIGLWLKYILNPSDILNLLFLQNWIESYSKLGDSWAKSVLSAYTSYSTDTYNWLENLKDQMDTLNLTTVDLFVRWKIWMLIWYPSLIKEIILAKKRNWWDYLIGDKFLRTAPIFQINAESSENSEKINLINYNYFVLSSYSNNKDMWFKFLNYLSTKSAQEEYSKSFNYYIPAFRSLEDSKLQENIEVWYDRTKFEDFLPTDVTLKWFTKWLKNEYDNYLNKNLDLELKLQANLLSKLQDFLQCNINHLINKTEFEKQCD